MANSIMTEVIKKELEDHSNQWNSLDFQVTILMIIVIILYHIEMVYFKMALNGLSTSEPVTTLQQIYPSDH